MNILFLPVHFKQSISINHKIQDEHTEDTQQHVRGQPCRLRPGHDDNPRPAGDDQRVYAALLDVGQVEQDDRSFYLLIRKALVRHLRLLGSCVWHLFHPHHGRHRI